MTTHIASRRLIVLIILLVLTSLAAHVMIDLESGGSGVRARQDVFILHTAILVPGLSSVVFSPASMLITLQQAKPRASLIPLPFHPPTL
jgi:hypothetical protein